MPTFNIQKALDSGKSEDEILGYLSTKNPKFNVSKALSAGKTKQDVMSYLSKVESTPVVKQEPTAPVGPSSGPGSGTFGAEQRVEQPQQDIPVPEWGKENPNLYGVYGAGKAVLEQAVTPAVEATGAVVGAMAGTPIIGGAIGYGASKQTMDMVEDYYAQLGGEKPKERTYGGELANVGKDVALVAATGKAFELAPKIIAAIPKAPGYVFESLPKRLAASAFKIPSSKKWISTLSGKDASKAAATTKEIIRSDIAPTEASLSKARQLTDEVHSFIDDVNTILVEDPNNVAKFNKTIAYGLKGAYKKVSGSADPKKAKALVDNVKAGLKQHGDLLNPQKLTAIKRDLWDRSQWFLDGLDPIVSKSYKGVARRIVEDLEKMYKPITEVNKVFAARMGVVEALERTLVAQGKSNIVPLPVKVLATGAHPKLAIIEATIGHPRVKAQIAQWLSKRRPEQFSKFIYPEKPLGYTPPVKQIEREVYSDLIKIRSGKNQQLIDAGYQETAGLSQGLTMPAKESLPLGATTISGVKDDVVKSIIPQIKTTIRPAEMKRMIKNKVAERIEKEEAIRLKHLEMQFKKQASAESSVGPPLRMPRNEQTRSTIPPSPEQRIAEMNKWGNK